MKSGDTLILKSERYKLKKLLLMVLLLSGCGVQAVEKIQECETPEPVIEYVEVETIVYVDRVETVYETIVETVTEYVEVIVEVPVEVIVYETITKTKTKTEYVEKIVEVPTTEYVYVKDYETVIFVGDSITYRFDLPFQDEDTLVFNYGFSSKTTTYIIAMLDEIISLKPDKLFLMIGVNDIALGSTQEEIKSNYDIIVNTLQTSLPDIEIYLQSILPVTERKTNIDSGLITLLNDDLQTMTTSGITYIDLHSLFIDDQGYMKSEYTIDGVHLTSLGYDIWIDKLRNDGVIE
jgi:lysophospholipase L1-like esterase